MRRPPPKPSRTRVVAMLALESILALFGVLVWRLTGDLFWLAIAVASLLVGVWVLRFL